MRLDYVLKIFLPFQVQYFTHLGGHMLSWLKRKGIFTLTSYNVCILYLIQKLVVTIFMIRDCQPDETIPDPIQQPNLFVELEVLTIGPHTFT